MKKISLIITILFLFVTFIGCNNISNSNSSVLSDTTSDSYTVSSDVITQKNTDIEKISINELKEAVKNDYLYFNNLENLPKDIYYFYIEDESGNPVANLRCFTKQNYKMFDETNRFNLSGLSRNTGLMPIQTGNETNFIIANTDVDGKPTIQNISIENIDMKDDTIYKIVWKYEQPKDTILRCHKKITVDVKNVKGKIKDANAQRTVCVNQPIAVNFNIKFSPYVINPNTDSSVDNNSISIPKKADIITDDIDTYISKTTTSVYKEIIDIKYTDEKGQVIYKVDYLPTKDFLKTYTISSSKEPDKIKFTQRMWYEIKKVNNIFNFSESELLYTDADISNSVIKEDEILFDVTALIEIA